MNADKVTFIVSAFMHVFLKIAQPGILTRKSHLNCGECFTSDHPVGTGLSWIGFPGSTLDFWVVSTKDESYTDTIFLGSGMER